MKLEQEETFLFHMASSSSKPFSYGLINLERKHF
uniref:Uncharacterized protein n=1 Tax=Nelumbo nucifera TaxID=4432 RepID=A0A822ZJP9_NELNU|nr:TPA_asm: hypothetical protein HUJ06_001819 [Nelumbo nucifera]